MTNFFKLLSLAALGLGLFGCASTLSPAIPASQGDQSGQTSQQGQPAQKDAGKEQEASQNSGAGQEGSQAAAGGNQARSGGEEKSFAEQSDREKMEKSKKEAGGESPSSLPTESDTPGTSQQAQEQKKRTPGEASQMTPEQQLAEAKRNLRISEDTEKRIAQELEDLKNTGAASSETIRDYEIYHESVQAIVAENRKIVEKMEAAKAVYSRSAEESPAAGDQTEAFSTPGSSTEQKADDVADLDRQLKASLNAFDSRLQREMEDIRKESSERMRYLAQEAAEAARQLRENSQNVDIAGSGSSTGSGETDIRTGQGRVSYEDDDIVARQLREAAEKETDPELKKKLWKEYYEYKENQRTSKK